MSRESIDPTMDAKDLDTFGSAIVANILSKSQYAVARKRTPGWVSYMIKAGRLTAPALREDGLINVAAADRMLLDRRDPFRGARKPFSAALASDHPTAGPCDDAAIQSGQGGTDPGHELNGYRTRREAADAQMRELQLAVLRGDMVPIGQLRRVALNLAVALRQGLADRAEELARQLREADGPGAARALAVAADQDLCAKFEETVRRLPGRAAAL